MRVPVIRTAILLALPAVLAACGRTEAGGREAFRLVAFGEADGPAVLLNEKLHFVFSAPVDPSSVTSRSISIRSEGGAPAQGRFEVGRDRVAFHPDRALARTLDDSGYRPATAYRVEVAGFPRPDGVRARDGRILERTVSASFRTVDPAKGIQPFLDDSPFQGPFPGLPDASSLQVRIGDPISIVFTEPLRPDTVTEEAFRLREFRRGTELEDVPIEVRLPRQGEGSVVEIVPRDPKPPPTSYVLVIRDRIQDYGGNRVPPLSALVEFLPTSPEETPEVFSEEFSTERNLDLEDPGEDGWAAWGNGTVSVQVPDLAGDGRLGAWSPAGAVRWKAGETARIPVEGGEKEAAIGDLPFSEVDVGPEADVRIEG